jgi:cation diffusion facilitator family transporter
MLMPCSDCALEAGDAVQSKTLRLLLLINAAMFACELIVGILADSSGVLADSLDMLADALVYGIGLYAVGRAVSAKILAARLSGVFQIAIALGMMVEIARRAVSGSEPVSWLMIGVSLAALGANIFCLRQISRHREGEVHMRASWIFSRNDVIANGSVIIAALLVSFTGSHWPDLIIGALITVVVLRGGISIWRDAVKESARQPG